MSTKKLEEVTSVCTTPKELIKSQDFIRWLEIILWQVKTFNKDYILWLFAKLQNDEVLDEEEKEELLKFVSDDKVARKWQELLSKLVNVSVNVKTNNLNEFNSFSSILNNIFAEDWYKKVTKYVWEVADIAKLTLNAYEWFTKLQITVNWETKEIHLENENLRVDSSNWEVKKIKGHNVKINPEWDITEYLDWPEAGQQLFDNRNAAEREAKKLWKRLPFAHDENKEFQAIIEKVWVAEFMKVCPGYRLTNWSDFCYRGVNAYFWSASVDWFYPFNMAFYRGDSRAYRSCDYRSFGLSVRCVKD
jgi:hypothetical protein